MVYPAYTVMRMIGVPPLLWWLWTYLMLRDSYHQLIRALNSFPAKQHKSQDNASSGEQQMAGPFTESLESNKL